LAGAAIFGWALWSLSYERGDLAALLFAATLILVAGQFPVRITNLKLAFSGADAFLFGAMVLIGPPAAVLLAGLDSFAGGLKATKRLSSRLFGPTAAMWGMGMASLAYGQSRHLFDQAGFGPETSIISALFTSAVVQYVVNTGLIQGLFALKRGTTVNPSTLLADTGWMAAVSIASALVVGLVISALGPRALQAAAVSAAVALLVLFLVNRSIGRAEAERQRQEALILAAQGEARVNSQRFSAAFTHAAGGMAITDKDGRVLQSNRALCDLLQLTESAVVGTKFLDLVRPEDRAALAADIQGVLAQSAGQVVREVQLCRGHDRVWASVYASRLENPSVELGMGLIYQVHDITERREAQEKLQFAAYHDGLTSLPNRLAFLQGLQAAIDRSKVDPTATFATLLLDLDRFKMVNDSLGHAAGNELLVEVARRLSSSVRPGDSVARLGGDEFGLMFDRIGSQQEAVSLAQRVVDTIVQPMQIGGSEFTVQCSIGLTLSDLGHRSADEMIRDADIAMYDAKGKGRGRISVFDTPMHDYVADRLYMEAELRRAISAGQITLVYQPIVMLPQRRLLGFEALARWHHPEMGMVDVPKFIVLAEESGFISQLTPWVIEMASLQMAAWQRVLPDGERLKMHVNISARDLELPGFTTSVATGLARARLSGHALTLEITETSLMRSMEHALPVMESLRRIGVGFSIDDFGTGYSSLSYLSALPIDSLKIDRSFVLGMDRGPQNVEIVRAILRLGQTLHMHVIAEGVETHEHLDALRDIGVEAGQGYLFSRPLPPAKMLEQLQLAGLQPG
jgi:diguanylate cyclase (GGDEF)-like protein/PAS domain S-box-containing protein